MTQINNIKSSKLGTTYPYFYFESVYLSNLRKYSRISYRPGRYYNRDLTYYGNFNDFLRDNIPKIKFWTKDWRFFI